MFGFTHNPIQRQLRWLHRRGDFFVKDRQAWVNITRNDFAQVTARIQIELIDLMLQDLCNDIVVETGLFHIRLPLPEKNHGHGIRPPHLDLPA